MTDTSGVDVYDPPPPPPSGAQLAAPALLAALGVTHLVVAVLFDECLQMFNLVVGLIEILIAIWLAVDLARWRKKHSAWLEGLRARISPQPPPPRV